MSDNHEVTSVLITLGAVILGWFLGIGSGRISKQYEIFKIKKALRLEIKDCLSWLLRNKLTLAYMIQQIVLKKLPLESPIKIPTHIYDSYFFKVSINFSQSERISFNSIHNHIKLIHEQIQDLYGLHKDCLGSVDILRLEEYEGILHGIYGNTFDTISLVNYHIKYNKNLVTFISVRMV